MRIEIAGLSRKSKSRFAAVVTLGDNKHKYVYDIPGDTITTNQAELTALKFALLGADGYPATIATYSQYVYDLTLRENGKWVKEPKSNVELINEIRGLLQEGKATIVCERVPEAKDWCANGTETL